MLECPLICQKHWDICFDIFDFRGKMLPCYHGQLCSDDAERILEGLSNSFLVRQSVVNMKTIISAVNSKGKVSHWLVPSSNQDISDQDIQRIVAANDFGHPVMCQEDSSKVCGNQC